MPKILIVYYSESGNTEQMAKFIETGAIEEGATVLCKKVVEKNLIHELEINNLLDDFKKADGIIIGSPTYYGSMAAPIKQLIDKSIKYHGKLVGKVGAAFTSSAYIAGGNEMTILNILHAMLVHGMIIQGDCNTDHFGPVSIGCPDNNCRHRCERLGRKVAELTKMLSK